MITLIFLASFLICWWSLAQKRRFARLREFDSLSAKLTGHIFQWSASLFIVLLFYHGLLALLAAGWKILTAAQLVRLEQWFKAAKQISDEYKPSWLVSTAALFGLYLLGRAWIRFIERETPFRFIKKVTGLLTIAANALFLLASFTLLGFQPGEPATTLAIHLQEEREEYGVLRAELADSLQAPVLNQVVRKITDTIPGGVEIPTLIKATVDEGKRLRTAYSHAQTSTNFHNERIVALAKRSGEQQRLLLQADSTAQRVRQSGRPREAAKLPDEITYEQISKARSSVKRFRESYNEHLLRLVEQPGGKELVLSLPEGVFDHFSEALDPLTESFPLFKPVVEILKSVTSDAAEKQINRVLNKLTDSVVKHPEQLGYEMQQRAHEVADSVPIQVHRETRKRLNKEITSAKRQIAELQASTRGLEKSVRIVEARRSQTLKKSQPPDLQASAPAPYTQPGRKTDEPNTAGSEDDGLVFNPYGSADTERLQKGLENGWVVTENPQTGKMFVHARSSGIILSDLRYLVKQSPDGRRWTIYLPSIAYDGTATYGRSVGIIDKPVNASVGECSCQ